MTTTTLSSTAKPVSQTFLGKLLREIFGATPLAITVAAMHSVPGVRTNSN